MYTIKIFAFIGIMYLIIGLLNIRSKQVDEIYKKIWGVNTPSNQNIVKVGIHSLLMEFLIDLSINLLLYLF